MYKAVSASGTYRVRSRRRGRRSFQLHKIVMFITFTLMIAFLCGITFGSIMTSAKTIDEKALDTFKYYKSITVEPGDSLWSIADKYISDEYSSYNDYIDELCFINSLDSTQIRAGRTLTVPYYSAEFK